jgi:hypothetical protein
MFCCTDLDARILGHACGVLGIPFPIADLVPDECVCNCGGGGWDPCLAAQIFQVAGLDVVHFICPVGGLPRRALEARLPDSVALLQIAGKHCGHGTRWGELYPQDEGRGLLLMMSATGKNAEWSSGLDDCFTGQLLIISHTVESALRRNKTQ